MHCEVLVGNSCVMQSILVGNQYNWQCTAGQPLFMNNTQVGTSCVLHKYWWAELSILFPALRERATSIYDNILVGSHYLWTMHKWAMSSIAEVYKWARVGQKYWWAKVSLQKYNISRFAGKGNQYLWTMHKWANSCVLASTGRQTTEVGILFK